MRTHSLVHLILYYENRIALPFVRVLLDHEVVRMLVLMPDSRDITPVAIALDEGKFDLVMLFVERLSIAFDAPVCRGLGFASYVAAKGNVDWLQSIMTYY